MTLSSGAMAESGTFGYECVSGHAKFSMVTVRDGHALLDCAKFVF